MNTTQSHQEAKHTPTPDALWLTAENAATHYYEGSAATGDDLGRRQYAYALGYYHARHGNVVIPHRVAELVRKVFLPRNPNKLRNCHPEVVNAAKDFIAQFESNTEARDCANSHPALLSRVARLREGLKGALPCLEAAEIALSADGCNKASDKCLFAMTQARALLAETEGKP